RERNRRASMRPAAAPQPDRERDGGDARGEEEPALDLLGAKIVVHRPQHVHSSQSRSRSLVGRYSSVTNEIPRFDSAWISYLTPFFTISWISFCHFGFWNQG